jgi:hypothetical protein
MPTLRVPPDRNDLSATYRLPGLPSQASLSYQMQARSAFGHPCCLWSLRLPGSPRAPFGSRARSPVSRGTKRIRMGASTQALRASHGGAVRQHLAPLSLTSGTDSTAKNARVRPHARSQRSSMRPRDCERSRQLIEQRLGLLQIQRVKALSEPAIDWREKIVSLLSLALVAPQPSHAHRRAEFPGLCLLLTGDG